jgi:hypothetical protein
MTFILPPECSFWLPGVLGAKVEEPVMILGEVASWCGFTWRLSLPTLGVDVDGLAYPLHWPTVCSYQMRGHGLLLGVILSYCCSGHNAAAPFRGCEAPRA